MSYLAIPDGIAERLRDELLAAAPLESGTFCLLDTVCAGDTERLVLGAPIETPEPWTEQDERRLTPSGRAISQAVTAANGVGCGLAFVHTHPLARARPRLSAIDRETSLRLAAAFDELLDGPFASLVLGPGGFGGVRALDGELCELDRLAVVGRRLEVYADGLTTEDRALDDRQLRALGHEGQRRLRELRVAVIGAGGLGSPTAETLVRMGAERVTLIDFDYLDTPSNARRVFGIGRAEVEQDPAPAKAEAVATALTRLRLGTRVQAVVGDIREPETRAALLEADLVVNGTDTHSSRAVLSELAVRGALPVIDIGVRVGTRRDGALDTLLFERRVLIPEGPCLWCWGRLDAEQVRAELLPDVERQGLIAEGYVTGEVGEPTPSVAALTVTAAGAAASAALAMLAGAFDVAPLAVSVDAVSLESTALARQHPDPECVCRTWRTVATGV